MTDFIDNLPPELLELVFEYLDAKDILNLSETCKRFNEIIERSDKLTKKLTLYVIFPSFMTSLKTMTKKSKRKYRNMCITRTRYRRTDNQFSSLIHAFDNIGSSIKSLTVNWCLSRNLDITVDIAFRRLRGRGMDLPYNQNISVVRPHSPQNTIRDEARDELYKEFTMIIKNFTNLEKTIWNNVNIDQRRLNVNENLLFNFSTLKELEMKQCDAYCFDVLSSCQNLTTLKISDPFWNSNSRNPGIDIFEAFLVSQKNLKNLHIHSVPRLFDSDLSTAIEFKLQQLVLKNVFFKEKKNAENFFKTQTELVSIDFQLQNEKIRVLDELQWYNNVIRTILSQNKSLKSINLDKIKYKIPNCDFLQYVTNESVQELKFNVINESKNAEFFKNLVRKLPNLSSIAYQSDDSEDNDGDTCFDKGTVLENIKELKIVNASVKSLINVYAENLHTFEYSPKLNGKFIDDYIGGFLHQHRNIRDLRIGCETGRSYFFVSYNLCQLIVNFLNELESITIYNFAEVNKSVKLLCTLRNLRSLRLSSLQYQQFTAKTKVECERMKLKLIPVEINYPYETREFLDS